MSKRQFLMVLGVLTIVILFLGFPPAWDKAFLIAVGALVIVTASRLKPDIKPRQRNDMPYVEHKTDIDSITGGTTSS